MKLNYWIEVYLTNKGNDPITAYELRDILISIRDEIES